MKEKFSIGDIVTSIAGRDTDVNFLVIDVDADYIFVVDGRTRKINSPKRKNSKHLKKVLSTGDTKTLGERIRKGIPTANQRVYKSIKFQTEKI